MGTTEKSEVKEGCRIELLAKKYIHDHRHPIVKVCLPSHKLFFGARNDDEKAFIKEHQDQFESILEHQRVEKRSNRAQAIWLLGKGIAKVTKIVKNLLKYYGYQNKEGVFLYPEEMLYLLETNRLEVMFADTSLSVEEAYRLVLNTPGVNLTRYRVYKKLANLGYKLIRFEQMQSRISQKIKNPESKRTAEDIGNCERTSFKKLKPDIQEQETKDLFDLSTSSSQAQTSVPREAEHISSIFEKLRKSMPRSYSDEVKVRNPDYYIWSPTNVIKVEPDYNIFICQGNLIDNKDFNSSIPNIYAICMDDVSFYRFTDVHIPYM